MKTLLRNALLVLVAFLSMGQGIYGTAQFAESCGCSPCPPPPPPPPPPVPTGQPVGDNPSRFEAIVISPLDGTSRITAAAPGTSAPGLCPGNSPANCLSVDTRPTDGSTAVYFDAIPVTAGHLLRGLVLSGGSRENFACTSRNYADGGYRVVIAIQLRPSIWDSWATVGRIAYDHLAAIEVHNGQVLDLGQRVGTLFGPASFTSCWTGIHLKTELQGADGQFPCYYTAATAASGSLESWTAVGRVGAARSSLASCDATAPATRGSPANTTPLPACVPGTAGYLVALCDGSFGIVFANPDGTTTDSGACCFPSAAEANSVYPGLTDGTSWGCMKSVGPFPCRAP